MTGKILYHVATDSEGNPLTAVFIDGNGKRYEVPYGEATEIESAYMADKIMEHCHYYGIVEVNTIKTLKGIEFDVDNAEARASEALMRSEKQCINDYIRTQLESRVKQNAPPLPPEGRALDCVVKHKFNLLRAGIRPVGWDPPYDMPEPEQRKDGTYVVGGTEVEARIRQLEEENKRLQNELRSFMQSMSLQMQKGPGLGKGSGKGGGKAKVEAGVEAEEPVA